MDCVGCDKCRLWGKLQITGMGTALKVLFSSVGLEAGLEQPEPLVLSRGEVVAFVNTLHRFSESLMAVDKFRKLWSDRSVERLAAEKIEADKLEVEKKKNKSEAVTIPIIEDPSASKPLAVVGIEDQKRLEEEAPAATPVVKEVTIPIRAKRPEQTLTEALAAMVADYKSRGLIKDEL